MSPSRRRNPVVVGVDASGSSLDAVDWATAEAAARGCPLRLVHIVHPPFAIDPYGVGTAMDGIVMAWTDGERILAEAADRARVVAPDIEVSARLAQATVVRALRDEADAACLLVLGHRTRPRARGVQPRSVCGQLARDAPCPVVVIRPPQTRGDRARYVARVVVGVDSTPYCAAAVEFAFCAARQRGVPLVAVHAQTPQPPFEAGSLANPEAVAAMRTWRTFESALGRWQGGFPDVSVHVALARADPGSALITQSHGAAMLVIGGTNGRSGARRFTIGLVSRTVIGHADSPIVIVRRDATLPTFRDRARNFDRGGARRTTTP